MSDVPALMMGGTFDAVTPISWQADLTPGLTNSQAVAFPGQAHAVYTQSTCAITVMNAFLAHPDQPVDQTCAEQIALPVFTTP